MPTNKTPKELARADELADVVREALADVDIRSRHAADRALAALAELQALAEAGWAFVRLYDEVDKSQRLDNTGGDSAVSITLWSFAKARAAAAPSPADQEEA